jgi:hypothetical protein
MSWEAQGWAIKQTTRSATNKWVLMCLASYADDNNECFPSIKTLIKRTELSKSTILRSIKDLTRNGFISVNERYVEFGDASRQTSNLYKLLINDDGYQNETMGYQNETHPSTSVKPHIINHNKSKYTDAFETFWKLYPRNDGSKKKAYELYLKAITKDIKESDLLSIVEKYKLIMKGKDVQYIPHCTTWLNQKRWETINEEYKNKSKLNLNQLVG